MKRALFLFLFLLTAALSLAETPASGPMLRFTATSANVSSAPDSIRIDVFRWSTDAERDKLMAAWELKPGAVSAAPAGRGGGRGGRGAGGGGGRGGRGATAAPATPAASDADATDAPPARGRGGAAGRSASPAPGPTPEVELAAALKESPTIGYLWSSEAAGYALRYAGKVSAPDGSDRVILITDRRLGEANGLWKPAVQPGPAAYGFSVIELRVNAKGTGEGKLSLNEKIAPDAAVGMVALANYEASPVVFTGLKRAVPVAQSNSTQPNSTQPSSTKK